MNQYVTKRNELLSQQIIKGLEKRNMSGYYAADKAEALRLALSLIPVAFVRKGLINMIFGSEPFEHKENISARKYGFTRVSFAVILVTTLFLAIYITADCAGTRPLWFMASKLGISLLASYLVSALIVNLLSYDDRR